LFSSTFSAGLDLADMYQRCSARLRPPIDKFMFDTLRQGITAPLHCSKPVACSLDGHAIAGGIILALACDYIAIGTRKPFRIGVTELAVGVPFPRIPLEIIRHQVEPQLAQRLIFDATTFSSDEFAIRCDRSDAPDDAARRWLTMVGERPLQGFQISKKKWWANLTHSETLNNEQEKQEYFETVTSDQCLQAIEQTLRK
jgi:enoyl-CoA hydratase